jgi:hypothetical protein
MVTAILDTNVFIRAALRPGSPSARVVDAYLDGSFRLVLSQAVLEELLTVLLLPEIREVHGWSDDKILQFMMNLTAAAAAGPSSLIHPGAEMAWASLFGLGRVCLLAMALGMIAGGATILAVGTTSVFVPQDLVYMGLSADDLHAINPRLVRLIAHDRAGFGGGVCTCGVLIFFCVWCGKPCPSLWQALCLAGTAGFVTAIGVHPLIGYTDPVHLAPAVAGAVLFSVGLVLTYRRMVLGSGREATPVPALKPAEPADSGSAAHGVPFERSGD